MNATDATRGFGVVNDGKAAGTRVHISETLVENDPGQQWEACYVDDSEYFTLKNPNSGNYLSAVTADILTIEPGNSRKL